MPRQGEIMKVFYLTIGVLALASIALAQTGAPSGAPPAPTHGRLPGVVAFLTDPWGTRIELTERSAAAPSAQR